MTDAHTGLLLTSQYRYAHPTILPSSGSVVNYELTESTIRGVRPGQC
jgi:hypothetical protein